MTISDFLTKYGTWSASSAIRSMVNDVTLVGGIVFADEPIRNAMEFTPERLRLLEDIANDLEALLKEQL